MIKKLGIVVLALFMLAGCNKEEDKVTRTNAITYSASFIEGDVYQLKITMIVDSDNLEVLGDTVTFGYLVTTDQVATISDINNSDNKVDSRVSELDDNTYNYCTTFTLEDYNKAYSIRGYYAYTIDGIEYIAYANAFYSTTPYKLALTSDVSYASSIIDVYDNSKGVVGNIKLSIDLKNNTVEALEKLYSASLETDYLIVKVTVTLIDNYSFANEVTLYVNGVVVDSSKYKTENNVLVYSYDEPNWTPQY